MLKSFQDSQMYGDAEQIRPQMAATNVLHWSGLSYAVPILPASRF